MSEDEARAWIVARHGPAAVERLAWFVALLLDETPRQNLIAASTVADVWNRHIVDSAQLAAFAGDDDGLWLDVGSGGGLPGIVLALLLDRRFVLCEPRRLRAAFLSHAVEELGLAPRVAIVQRKVEQVDVAAMTISARAVAAIDRIVATSRQCADAATRWILPRGQAVRDDIDLSAMLRTAMFHVEPSITDPRAGIVVATGLAR